MENQPKNLCTLKIKTDFFFWVATMNNERKQCENNLRASLIQGHFKKTFRIRPDCKCLMALLFALLTKRNK